MMSLRFLWLFVAMVSARKFKGGSADNVAQLGNVTANDGFADLRVEDTRALLSGRRRKGGGDPVKELKKMTKKLKDVKKHFDKIKNTVKKGGSKLKKIGKDIHSGVKDLDSQIKDLAKAVPSPEELKPLLQQAMQAAVKHLVPLAEQVPDLVEKLAKDFLGGGCLKKMLSNAVELPPEPFDLFKKEWTYASLLVQADDYIPDVCVAVNKIRLDTSGLGPYLAKIPGKALNEMKPMFQELAGTVEKEVIKPIDKIVQHVKKQITKGPKTVFKKIEKSINQLQKLFNSASLLQLAEGMVESRVNNSAIRNSADDEDLDLDGEQHTDGKEDQQDEDAGHDHQEQEEEGGEPQLYEEAPNNISLQKLQRSFAKGGPPFNLKELSMSLQLKFKPKVTLDFGASFSQEGDILGLVAEKLGIADQPWNQKFATRADILPGLWLNVATTIQMAWPYVLAAEARAKVSFKYSFEPKLLISFVDGKLSFDLANLKGKTDLHANVNGWASVATKASAKVIVTVQICTIGVCFDATTKVVQSVEAGADVYGESSESGVFAGKGFLPYAAMRSAADFQWASYPQAAVVTCEKALPGLCTGSWLHVPSPKVDIALGTVVIAKLRKFKKFSNVAGKGALVSGLFPGTKLYTLSFDQLGKRFQSPSEESEATKNNVTVETIEQDLEEPPEATSMF